MKTESDEVQASVPDLFKKTDGDPVYLQEKLILEVTESIWEIMNRKKVNKTELAKRIKTSKPNVTQLLNGGRNMTLRTLSDIAVALDATVRITVTSKKPPRALNWAQQQRENFIAEKLLDPGYIVRADLMEEFKISMPQATTDFSGYRDRHPNAMLYNPSRKRYEAPGFTKPSKR